MTSSKNIILVIVVIVIFIAAAFVLFTGAVPGQKASFNPTVKQGNAPTSILPHGNQLDFSKVEKYNPDGRLFNYPTVSPDNVGANLPDILKIKTDSQ